MTATAQRHNVTHAVAVFPPAHLRVVADAGSARGACENCTLSAACVPDGLCGQDRKEFTALVVHHKRLQAGQALFRAGEPFHQLYFVKTGSLKTVVLLNDGREQVTGFHFGGDILGVDAISAAAHPSEAVALEDTHVCAIPFAPLSKLSRRLESVQSYLYHVLAREVVRDQAMMLLLGRMQAEERVAAFLMNLSERFKARGYSPLSFTLPMAREEIGNYLGLTLETVSRCFSRLKGAGVLRVENRNIRICDPEALRKVIGGREDAAAIQSMH